MRELQKEIYALAVAKGWYDGADLRNPVWLGARLALIHSEVSEALECVRDGQLGLGGDARGKPVGLPSELADIIIRVLDLAESLGIDMKGMVRRKHEYNKTRTHRHGGKAL